MLFNGARELLEGLGLVPPTLSTPVSELRSATEALVAQIPPPSLRCAVEDRLVEGDGSSLIVRLYRPDHLETTGAGVILLHGGGWVLGDLDGYDGFADRLAMDSGCLVASVGYRLAPEHPFPAAVEDAYRATRWLSEEAGALSIDPGRLGVVGDSAGGNLAAVVSLMARDRGGPPLALQALIYPVTRCSWDPEDFSQEGDSSILTAEAMAWFCRAYLPDDADGNDPNASPLLAPDLRSLPPTFLMTAEVDPLAEQGRAYGDRLRAAGVPVTQIEAAGMFHGFLSFAGALPAADEAFDDLTARIRSTLTGPRSGALSQNSRLGGALHG